MAVYLSVNRDRETGKEIVFGFHDETNKLLHQLMGGKKQLQIISIVEMVGLGKTIFFFRFVKTTLARKVFHQVYVIFMFVSGQ